MNDASDQVMDLLKEAKKLALQYRALTGKPLGITGEVAEYEAAEYEAAMLLQLELAPARQAGYDATEIRDGSARKLQIKGRCLPVGHKPGQRIGSIRLNHEWDAVLLVLLDENLDALEIWEADRSLVETALDAPGSIARNERGALSVSKFKQIGTKRWPTPTA